MLGINIYPSKNNIVVSDILVYTIEVKNQYEFEVEDIIIKSTLDEQIRFIKGSISKDNTIIDDENIISGINIGHLKPGSSKSIKFKVEVIAKKNNFIDVKFFTEFKYASKEDNRKYWESITTQLDYIYIYNPTLKVLIESNTNEVQLNDIIEYKISLHNNGDLDLFNMYLVDLIPHTIGIIDGSFSIDSKIINSVDIEKGVILGDLYVGKNMCINYKAKVISGSAGGKIKNSAKIGYYFKLDNNTKLYKETEEYSVNISMDISNFKQVTINNNLSIGNDKPKLKEINDIKADITIDRYSIIKTSIGASKEGLKLSGYKLIVHGRINEVVEYESNESISYIYSSQYETNFSTYIVLPRDFVIGTNIELSGNIQNISYKKINEENFYRSVDFIVLGKLKCY